MIVVRLILLAVSVVSLVYGIKDAHFFFKAANSHGGGHTEGFGDGMATIAFFIKSSAELALSTICFLLALFL